MGVHNTPQSDHRWDGSENEGGDGADAPVATDGGQHDYQRTDRDAIGETVEALFENRSSRRQVPTPDEIQNALADGSTAVEARIKLREALRDIDLDEREATEADIRAVMTAQEILEEDVKELLRRVRHLERTIDSRQQFER